MRSTQKQNLRNSIIKSKSEIQKSSRGHKTIFVTLLLLLLTVEDPVSQIFPLFGYLDEIVALIGAIYYIVKSKKNKYPILGIWIPLVLYSAVGFVSAMLYGERPIVAIGIDWFLSLKFFFALSFGIMLYNQSWDEKPSPLIKLIKIVTIIFFIGAGATYVGYYIFSLPVTISYNTGLPFVSLWYSHEEYLASAQVCLFVVTLAYADKIKNCGRWIFLQVLVIASTGHYKAIAVAMLGALAYIVVIKNNGRFKKRYLVGIAFVVVLIGWDYLQLNYGADATSARGLLQSTSFVIAKDYFPLGMGFSTYGSYMSSLYYSPAYFQYGLSNVWGLQDIGSDPQADVVFISDTFWPMIIGQTGVIGTTLYILVVIKLFLVASKIRQIDKYAYTALMFSLFYLLIQSTASAAFVGPNAIPIAIVMGAMYSRGYQKT